MCSLICLGRRERKREEKRRGKKEERREEEREKRRGEKRGEKKREERRGEERRGEKKKREKRKKSVQFRFSSLPLLFSLKKEKERKPLHEYKQNQKEIDIYKS